MERALENEQPKSVLTITASPGQLRVIADRLEAEARQHVGAGREIFYNLTANVTLMFDPRSEQRQDSRLSGSRVE